MTHRPPHGGRLIAASRHTGIALEHWLDLSCALNPWPWPVPAIPAGVFQRLPEDDDGLSDAARACYGSDDILPVPGTQSVIAAIPRWFAEPRRVWLPVTGYQEHRWHWIAAGHTPCDYTHLPAPSAMQRGDIVVVIQPNNPLASIESTHHLRALADALANLDGLLVIDEAFVDATPQHSLITHEMPPHVIILRSFGKFFGLAGLRLGFLVAAQPWRAHMSAGLQPWSINTPARWIGERALRDTEWQALTRQRLSNAAHEWQTCLQQALPEPSTRISATALFATAHMSADRSDSLHAHLMANAILARKIEGTGLLRFGLPASAEDNRRVMNAIRHWPG